MDFEKSHFREKDFLFRTNQTEEKVTLMPPKKEYKDYRAARRSFAHARSSAGRQSMLYRPNIGPRVSKTEIKALDLPTASYTVSTTATITPLNLIRAGTSFFNRVGRKVQMKSLHIKGFLNPLRTVAGQDYLRIMVVYDSQTNGTAPAIADILQDTDQAGTNTTDPWCGPNLNNKERFKVLMDEKILGPSITITAGVVTNLGPVDLVAKTFEISRYIKLKGLVAQYKADSSPAVIGDIATGGLYLVTLGNNLAAVTGWQFTAATRLRYRDV